MLSSPSPSFAGLLACDVREAPPAPTTTATTAIILHGLTGDRTLLRETCDARLEAHGLRRVYLDLPGHGQSPPLPHGSAEAVVDALVEAVDAVVAPGAPLLAIGYSYGAYLALGLAARRSVAGLFLACPVLEPEFARRRTPAPHAIEAAEDTTLAFEDEHERDTFRGVAVLQTQAVLARYRALVMAASRATDRSFVALLKSRYVLPFSAIDHVAGQPLPIGIVCGRHDHWVGFEDAARLVAHLPDASLRIVARAGHLLPLEAPGELHAALDEWLARIPRDAQQSEITDGGSP